MSKVLEDLTARYPALSGSVPGVEMLCNWLIEAYTNGGKLLIGGNGGSCADAEHIAGELLKSFKLSRPLPEAEKRQLAAYGCEGEILARDLEQGLPCLTLNSHIGFLTAFGNDVDPQLAFAQQLYAQAKPGDVFLGISTSGNSRNVYYALLVARLKGLKTALLTGDGCGRCESVADLVITVPAHDPYLVQEYHLPLYHAMCMIVEEHFYG